MPNASDELAQCVRTGNHEQAAALLRRVSPCELPSGAKWTPLHLAAHLGRLRVLRIFLQYLAGATKEVAKGAVDVRDHRRRTALHLATRAGHAAAVKLLLRAGASLDARDEAGDTPVVAAAAGGRVEVVGQPLTIVPGGNSRVSAVSEALAAALARAHCVTTAHAVLRARPRVAIDKKVMTQALLSLCQSYAEKSPLEKCPLNSAKLLCTLGADVDAVDEDGRTALHYAAAWGWVELVRFLLVTCCSTAINKPDFHGLTTLVVACVAAPDHTRCRVLRLLLQHGANPNPSDTSRKQAPMYSVAYHNDIKAVRLLMEAGARIHNSDNYIHSAVNSAAFHGSRSLLQWFASSGFDYSASKTGSDRPPFLSAAFSCNIRTMKLLVKLGANPRALDKREWSALHFFVMGCLNEEKSRGNDAVPVDDIIRYLVRKCGIDPNLKTRDDGVTAMHIASDYGIVSAVRALVGCGGDVNSVDSCVYCVLLKTGYYALMNSSYWGHTEVCKILLASGADVTRRAETSLATDALLQAAQEGHDDICSLLIQHGASADVRARWGLNGIWLRLSASKYATASVAHLLSCGMSPSAFDSSSGQSSLHLAVQKRQTESARLLIESGADISTRDAHGRTPLHFTCFGGPEMVLVLFEKGVDIHARDRIARTALHYAACCFNISVINCLVKLGSDINAKDASGWSPLMYACSRDESEADQGGDDTMCVIGEILRLDGRVNARTHRGLTALHFVCAHGRQDSAMQLVASGARLEARTRSGRTPLHLAAIANKVNVVRTLIGMGACLDMVDAMGCSPLYSAAARGHRTIVRELLAHGASVETRNRSGRTALDAADRAGHAEVFALLLSARVGRGCDDEADACSRTQRTLDAARRHGRTESVRLLAPVASECGGASPQRAGRSDATGMSHGARADKELEEVLGGGRMVDQLSERLVGVTGAKR